MNNRVKLIDYSQGDMAHCIAAWASTDLDDFEKINDLKELYEKTYPKKRNTPESLLQFLADHGHTSPFEFSQLVFLVDMDVASHIQSLKHRIATPQSSGAPFNSESARYRELRDKWYIPQDWQDQVVEVDEGSDLFLYDGMTWADALNNFTTMSHELYHTALSQLTKTLGRKRAKETARYFLTYNKQISSAIQFNFSSFLHFYRLRQSEHAQKEIAEIAESMLQQIKDIEGNPFRFSIKAWDLW